jgi:hypothetical protein
MLTAEHQCVDLPGKLTWFGNLFALEILINEAGGSCFSADAGHNSKPHHTSYIVNSHKGEITLEREPGNGTTFAERLPVLGEE